jgi:hypothetical protein
MCMHMQMHTHILKGVYRANMGTANSSNKQVLVEEGCDGWGGGSVGSMNEIFFNTFSCHIKLYDLLNLETSNDDFAIGKMVQRAKVQRHAMEKRY